MTTTRTTTAAELPAPIATSNLEVFLPDQNCVVMSTLVQEDFAPTQRDAREWSMRAGETLVVRRAHFTLVPSFSRFASTQPDGTWKHISWGQRRQEGAEEIIATFQFTRKGEWKKI